MHAGFMLMKIKWFETSNVKNNSKWDNKFVYFEILKQCGLQANPDVFKSKKSNTKYTPLLKILYKTLFKLIIHLSNE